MFKITETPMKWTRDMKTSHMAGFSLALIAAIAGCNSHPVSPNTREGVVEIKETFNIEGSEQVDILWVIDNSGSMCQEQKVLRDNFDLFIEELNW